MPRKALMCKCGHKLSDHPVRDGPSGCRKCNCYDFDPTPETYTRIREAERRLKQ